MSMTMDEWIKMQESGGAIVDRIYKTINNKDTQTILKWVKYVLKDSLGENVFEERNEEYPLEKITYLTDGNDSHLLLPDETIYEANDDAFISTITLYQKNNQSAIAIRLKDERIHVSGRKYINISKQHRHRNKKEWKEARLRREEMRLRKGRVD